MKGKLIVIIGIIYVILSVVVTKFLLDRNDYGAFETSSNYYVYSDKIEEYSNTSLVKFSKENDYTSLINKKVYYYNDDKEIQSDILTDYNKDEKIFTINDTNYNVEKMLGIPSKGYLLLGVIINFLTTKLFYLIFIIIPVTILLIYEIYLLFVYIRNGKSRKSDNNERNKA